MASNYTLRFQLGSHQHACALAPACILHVCICSARKLAVCVFLACIQIVCSLCVYAAGLRQVIEYTQNMDLHEEEGLLVLGSIITSVHKLLEHPHNQVGKTHVVLRLISASGQSSTEQSWSWANS